MKPSHMNPRWLGWRMGDASRSHLRPGHPHAGGAPTSLRPCRGAGKQAARPVPPFAVIYVPRASAFSRKHAWCVLQEA